jgi:hypothetical protein
MAARGPRHGVGRLNRPTALGFEDACAFRAGDGDGALLRNSKAVNFPEMQQPADCPYPLRDRQSWPDLRQPSA